MYCKFCGRGVDEKSDVCPHCGRRIRNSVGAALEGSEWTRLRPLREPKSPGLAGFLGFVLSWILMGPVGYIYLGQWNWFFITFVVELIAYPLTFGTAYVLFPFVFAFHQYQMARELNDKLAAGKPDAPSTGNEADSSRPIA
jgi:hypothetical protein